MQQYGNVEQDMQTFEVCFIVEAIKLQSAPKHILKQISLF